MTKAPCLLKAIVDALKKQEFKVEIDDLWRSDSSLMQGEISVKMIMEGRLRLLS